MPPAVTVALLAAAGVAALWGMRSGWQRRGERTAAAVPDLPDVPAADDRSLGAARTAPIEGTYVSSTVSGDWLERVVAQDLGTRSAAVVQVFDAGVRIERPGARNLFLPASALRAAGTSGGMAGKYVGGQGLVVLTWQPPASGAAALDTGLRLRRSADREPLLTAVRGLIDHTDAGDRTAGPDDAGTDTAGPNDAGAPGGGDKETA
ncbi:PH-like domain-containing protein [Cellulomonas aerilata]|uniref:PH domain-containing protein n=1 Tax=Cellulomonas aerilata TaxID=515326 RepID=A0A512DAB4_9CELL|nr:hypothetical protein [Cellulomonas aerilata]GEO33421.1 hypothetical protein CAE01nite_11460 [Cellulomonas aerilata]